MASPPLFTLGIEEEYHLVDRTSRDLAIEPPAALMQRCKAQLAEQVSPEFLKAQIEVGTRVRDTLAQARVDLALLRRTVADLAGEYNLAPIAAATHPFAQWNVQKPSEGPRYSVLARDLQMVGRRLVICGMHVHIGIEDPDLRIDLMNQASYFLPHLLALSASSPFWRGADTGLKSFRLSVFNGLPRTGLPERFDSWGEYQRHVRTLIEAKLIEDASNLWWDLRPSAHFPTLELRITDIPTRLDDTIALAALFRCVLRMLWRLRRANQRWRLYPHMLINENRWRAQRYGIEEGLVDFGRGQVTPMAELVEELLEELREDAEYFGCRAELARLRAIVAGGTSADRQRQIYRQALAQGASDHEALCAVVDHLIAETIDNLDDG